MSKQKPIVGNVIPANRPVILDKEKDQRNWSFSFRYYSQAEYFGLGETSTKWFVSLLERLRDLCKENIDSFFKDYGVKDANRYHKINWDAKNIPISRNEIDWVDKNICCWEPSY